MTMSQPRCMSLLLRTVKQVLRIELNTVRQREESHREALGDAVQELLHEHSETFTYMPKAASQAGQEQERSWGSEGWKALADANEARMIAEAECEQLRQCAETAQQQVTQAQDIAEALVQDFQHEAENARRDLTRSKARAMLIKIDASMQLAQTRSSRLLGKYPP